MRAGCGKRVSRCTCEFAPGPIRRKRGAKFTSVCARSPGGENRWWRHRPDEAPELRILFELFDDVRRQGNWVDSFFAYLQKPNNADAALIDCGTALGLDAVEVLAISLDGCRRRRPDDWQDAGSLASPGRRLAPDAWTPEFSL